MVLKTCICIETFRWLSREQNYIMGLNTPVRIQNINLSINTLKQTDEICRLVIAPNETIARITFLCRKVP